MSHLPSGSPLSVLRAGLLSAFCATPNLVFSRSGSPHRLRFEGFAASHITDRTAAFRAARRCPSLLSHVMSDVCLSCSAPKLAGTDLRDRRAAGSLTIRPMLTSSRPGLPSLVVGRGMEIDGTQPLDRGPCDPGKLGESEVKFVGRPTKRPCQPTAGPIRRLPTCYARGRQLYFRLRGLRQHRGGHGEECRGGPKGAVRANFRTLRLCRTTLLRPNGRCSKRPRNKRIRLRRSGATVRG